MDFSSLLGTLARSSAQAVSTLARASEEIEQFKEYLYVETEIEKCFVDILDSTINNQQIIFLCGSSGDGKSQLLRRHYDVYKHKFCIHLDATHSFKPDQDAIQALDLLFDSHRSTSKPLIVGINIGMLLNFRGNGAEQHEDIKQAISRFVDGERNFDQFNFLSFEDYPKFSLDEGNVGSEFISELLTKVTVNHPDNALFTAYQSDQSPETSLARHNYRLLQQPAIQQLIIQTLLQARLKFDQLFSTRALLDFVHHLIAGGQVLFDNLFASPKSGLASILVNLDPCLIRTQKLDEFVVQQSLGIQNEEFKAFKASYAKQFGPEELTAPTWVRAFYLLQRVDIGNNYHRHFNDSFRQDRFDDYVRLWQLHRTTSDRRQLRDFYDKHLIAALLKFANRLAPKTVGDGIYLAERNSIILSAKVRISMDSKALSAANNNKKIQSFNAALKVGERPISPFPVTISFLELVQRILAGYRPNRHDKNTVVIFEEVIEEIIRLASQSEEIRFHKAKKQWSLRLEDGEFLVEDEA
jgi:DNA phosphorothioation-dependent restriction protein DptF